MFSQQINFFDEDEKNHIISFGKKIQHLDVIVQESKKSHLQQIQKVFTPYILNGIVESSFAKECGIFLYSNDSQCISDYFEKTGFINKSKIFNDEKSFDLLNALNPKPKQNIVGVVLGNGFILSLLPEIPADNVLLLDVENVVHYFLLKIRNLILEADTNKDFTILKKEMIANINELEMEIYNRNPSLNPKTHLNIYAEKESLGDKHFLSSESRFQKCKIALQKKELLPIKIDIFNTHQMEELGAILNKNLCKVSFLNLTNVGDYDNDRVLKSQLNKIPLTHDCKIISTSIVRYPNNDASKKAFLSQSLEELSEALSYIYDNSPFTSGKRKLGK